ncbi:hypothetical protein CDN99_11950 [Roseateles aquatilis]|uniref:Uncharacterized protein n=1 Tax=Roseateles aquatilis TaxID=431061 RepID=A0A246JEF2_9BURK|nr:hypothetical protein CDN99_11950 [Roseateles aquatilis]
MGVRRHVHERGLARMQVRKLAGRPAFDNSASMTLKARLSGIHPFLQRPRTGLCGSMIDGV